MVISGALHVSGTLLMTFGGVKWPWADARNIALYAIFGAMLLLFAVTQYWAVWTTEKDWLFPGEFLYNRSLVLLYFIMACEGNALFVAIYYIPL